MPKSVPTTICCLLTACAAFAAFACVPGTSDKRSGLESCTTDGGGGSGSDPVSAAQTITATIDIDATAAGAVTAGPYVRGGVDMTTSAAALRNEQAHAKNYDGKTTFTGTYTIVLDDTGALDKTKSKLTLKTKTFSDRGNPQTSTFTTNDIGITDVTFTTDCPPKVKSFTFSSSDWYPADGTGNALLKDRTLTGSIDLATGTASYTAKYASKSNGAIYTYQVNGTVAMPLPPDGGGSGSGSGSQPFVAEDDWLAPPSPDYELADAGTFCDDTIECDFPDGLTCITGFCQ